MWILARQFESIILKYTCGSSRKCAPKDTHSKWKGRFPSSIRGKQKPIFTYCIMCVAHGKLDPVAIGTSGWPLHSLFAQKGPFWAIGARKRLAEQPNGHVTENRRYPELPQDMGKLWSDRVEFVWGQKKGLYGRSVEKSWFMVNFIKIGNF